MLPMGDPNPKIIRGSGDEIVAHDYCFFIARARALSLYPSLSLSLSHTHESRVLDSRCKCERDAYMASCLLQTALLPRLTIDVCVRADRQLLGDLSSIRPHQL
jgi:hypothetical protein